MATDVKKHKKRWVFWALAVFFYLYEYFIRVSPTVMVPELMQSFHIEAVQIGILAAAYLYAYAFMQIPVGMMMDKYGARRLLSFAAFVCAIGCGFYAGTDYYWFVVIGRILMGIGSAFGFLGMVYICSHWFERTKIATMIAIGNSFGMVGAIAGEGPLALSVIKFGWRAPILFLGAVGLLLAIVMFFVLRSDDDCRIEQQDEKSREKIDVKANLKEVASNPQSWLIGIGTFLIYSTTTGFAALWGVPFLQSTYGFGKDKASFAISMIFVGWIVGGPLLGKISDRIKHRRLILIFSSIAGAILMSVLVYRLNLSIVLLYAILFLVGFCSSAENLCYCLAIEHNPQKAKGVASAFINFILFLGAASIPIIVGSLLQIHWDGSSVGGIPAYSASSYKFALTTFPLTFILAAIFFIFVKKSPFMALHGKEYYS